VTLAAEASPVLFDRAYLLGDRVSMATERFVSDVTAATRGGAMT